MLDRLRPRRVDGLVVRVRSDGSAGLHHPPSDASLEVAADQASVLGLIDGRRSLAEIAEAGMVAQGALPLAAMRDLLRALAERGLLANAPAELAAAGLPQKPGGWRRLLRPLGWTVSLPAGGPAAILGALACVAAMLGLARATAHPVDAADVLFAYAGASLALTAAGFFQAAVLGALGQPARTLRLQSALGVIHLKPDTGGVVLLERSGRLLVYLAAVAGAAGTVWCGLPRAGLAAGAYAVFLALLCPFAPTPLGRALATLSGRVDLREHARAYLGRRFLRRVTSTAFFAGEASLIASALLSLGWLTLVVRTLLQEGTLGVLLLVHAGMGVTGWERALAYLGALGVALAMPLSLGVLGWALVRALSSLWRDPRPAAGERTGTLPPQDLKSIPVFSNLGETELVALSGRTVELKFRAGERIVIQGEAGDRFFAIRQGTVRVEREDPSGLVREVARLGPGDCFGEVALLEAQPRTATVRTDTEARVAVLSRASFDEVRKSLAGVDITQLLRATAALHQSPLFRQLAPDRLSALAVRLRPRAVHAGELLVKEGDRGQECYLISAGRYEVLGPGGERISTLGPGDHFGEISLLRDIPRTASVRALEDGLLLALDRDTFLSGVSADLSVSTRLEELAALRAEERR